MDDATPLDAGSREAVVVGFRATAPNLAGRSRCEPLLTLFRLVAAFLVIVV